MNTVTISSKYQIVIPKSIREKHDLSPGQKVQIFYYNGRIEVVPITDIKSVRGIAKGIDTDISREKDRL
ncbi:MAG: AbrB/MazE/SpoVT family DNA-binding domain-containing protein [Spirochaetia bacterium]|nr:AbrB/MazE/SpoVT family DNA-binding domain-containing protein [Spirochaetia bacterium]